MDTGRRLFGRRRRRGGGRASGALAGVAAGAGLAYFLDPRRGAGRRSDVVQRAGRFAREVADAVETGARDLSLRARGIAHEARARVEPEHPIDDVVVERVRAKLGRVTAHPHAIHVASRGGVVELVGPVLGSEHAQVVRAVRMVRGVRHLEDRLEPHDAAEGVPSLQGRPPRTGPVPEVLQARWSPGIRLLVGAAGAFLVLRALFGRGASRLLAGFAGVAVLGRVMSESGAGRREAHRIASRLARERGEGPGGGGSRGAKRSRRTPEVREVKSPSEIEPGIAHGSPEPTFSDRVDRAGKGGDTPPPGGWRTSAAEDEQPAAGTGDVEPETRYVAPPPGVEVRESEIGSVAPHDSRGDEEPGSEGERS